MINRKLAIIIPTLNESEFIIFTLIALQECREQGHCIILVDGGSSDATLSYARPWVDEMVICTPPQRARQLNAGAAAAKNCDYFLFLHADTVLSAPILLQQILPEFEAQQRAWGYFSVRLSGDNWRLRVVEYMMNQRACWTGIGTGDQGLLVTQQAFAAVGGFPEIALMEDVAICAALKRQQPPHCLPMRVLTSSRRWERQGISKTILLMWTLRLAYALGVSPDYLRQWYR
ncbi:TIGR04283 family arsenosugar biosynthesis glycosyltransferase [Thioflexithrix psekupsensis]|uniref:Glycosyltransferase 2-like domain-containing protein n=1 Tax=Thioflexithrix psekupsensis TaxID=1570016 RepID=A0A251X5Y8_9GAMM|nr:TIGR04283 family arsenosugar biosynthesis glycosyltransferase [Thioflexithrix psekupsensis]OUD12347.1 hypothetical protein TPSD3_14640 [Thioflexithrix psekupsensis]